jgi:tape measure domain-containing protein
LVKKVQAQMSTEVALDMLKASESIKSITTRVNSFTQSWKASEAQMKSAGDYVGAATAKYEGLGKSISAQQDKIAKLRKEQSELKGNTEETAQEYLKYQRQIDQATTRLSSLEAQQNRAKHSMEYQKSGLAGLQHSLELNNKAIQSHVERLQAEGKSEEAQVAKIKGLDTALENLTSQYKKQRTETIAAARDFGDTSDEYLKAKTRLNETATAMAKTRTETNELRASMEKQPTGFLVGIKEKLMSVNTEAKKTSKIGDTIKGVFGGSLLYAGVISLTSHIKEVASSGYEAAEAAVETGEKWSNIGINTKGVQSLALATKDLKENTNLSGVAVGNMLTKFYGITGTVKGAEQLSKGVGSLTDELKLSQQASDGFANGLSKIEASGTVTSSSLGRLEKQAPGLTVAMQKASGMSKKAFDDLLDSGKMTSDQFNDILEKASKSYDENSKEFDNSSQGAMKHFKQTWADTKAALMKPLVSVTGSGLGALNKALDNPATQKAVTALGTGIANLTKRLSELVPYISSHMADFTSISGSVTTIAGIFAKTIWQTISGTIKSISKDFGNFGLSAKQAKDPVKLLASGLQDLAKHKALVQDIAKALLTLFVGSKITSGALSMTRGIVRLSDSIKAIKTAQAVEDLGKLKGATKGFAAIKLGAKWVGGKAVSAGKLALNGLKTAGRGIGKALTFTAKIAVKGARLALKGLLTAAQVTGRGLKTAFLFLKANPFIAIISGVALVVTALVALYKHNKKFRNFVNGIAKDAKKYIGKAVDAVKNLGKWAGNIGSGAKKGWNNFTKTTSTGAKNAVKSFLSLKNDAGKHLANLWNSGKSTFSNGWKAVTNASKSGAHNVGNWFSNMANDTRKKAIQMFNDHKATFRSGYNVLNNYTQAWHDVMTGKWNKVGSDLKNTANSIKSFAHNIFSDMYNNLNNMTGGRLGDMVNAWKSKMSAIGNTVSDAKESIHKHFVDLVRGIVKPFNDMLSGLEKGINWVLDKVGASKISGDWSVPMPSYANGTQDTHQGGLAKVNDGSGANYREMYHLPNGQIGMFPAVKNMIVPLPKGTSVLDGNKSALLAKMMGIPGYASGIGDFFSGLWNGAKDVLDDTEDILKKPAEFMESLFKHFLDNTSSKIGLVNDILTNFPTTVAKDAVDWVKKQFQSIANPTGSGVARWEPIIKAVAASMNFNISGSQVSKLLRQIQTESNGDPTVLQKTHDINSASGHPAQGLLQFIPKTFARWALKGHTNIMLGSDQIRAAINALNHGGEGGWSNIGNGHGWENGGIVRNWQYAQIAEHNKPEAVMPLEAAKDSRAWQVLKAVVDAKTGGKSLDTNNTGSTSTADSKIAELTSVVNSMATMMKTIIGLNADQITATKGIVGYDKSAVYHQTSTDQSLAGFQSFS